MCVCLSVEALSRVPSVSELSAQAATRHHSTGRRTTRHCRETVSTNETGGCLSVRPSVCLLARDAASYRRPLLSGTVSAAVSVSLSAARLVL